MSASVESDEIALDDCVASEDDITVLGFDQIAAFVPFKDGAVPSARWKKRWSEQLELWAPMQRLWEPVIEARGERDGIKFRASQSTSALALTAIRKLVSSATEWVAAQKTSEARERGVGP